MVNESLTKLLNKGVIKIKRKKTMKKNTSNSAKKYNEFLKKRRSMSNIKNPIDSIITQSVKDMKSIPNIKMIEKPVNQKLVTKVQSYDKPKINIKLPKTKSTDNKIESEINPFLIFCKITPFPLFCIGKSFN